MGASKFVGIMGGYSLFVTDIPDTLKHPTGKKDGNRLGKRKKMITISRFVVMEDIRHVYGNEKSIKRLKNGS